MRVPAAGRRSYTSTLSEKTTKFAGLNLDVIRQAVSQCLRLPVIHNGLPSKGVITSPKGAVLAQVRNSRIDGYKPLSFTTIPANFLDTFSFDLGYDILFLDAGKSRNTRQCSVDQSRRWNGLATQGSYYSAIHVDLFH